MMGKATDIADRLEQLSSSRELTEAESLQLQRALRGQVTRPCDHPRWYRPWNAQDDAAILKARAAKMRAIDMARIVGRTPGSIYVRIHELKKMTGPNARAARKRIKARAEAKA